MNKILTNTLFDLPPGSVLISDFVSSTRESELLAWVDGQDWREELRRRVQHYGWSYDYRARRVTADACIGPLPTALRPECELLLGAGLFDSEPSQIIVNEYTPGQGIAPHIDCVPCFGPVIASLSLGSQCEMVFSKRSNGAKASCLLDPGSLLVLGKAARFEWSHGIPAHKSDLVDGKRKPRERRVSLTYRTMLPVDKL